ncbi:hypothetical protein ACFL5F_01945 [Planctomycetota bacterium]
MELNTSMRHLQSDSYAWNLYSFLNKNKESLNLSTAHIWHNFPVYKEEEGGIIKTRLLVISKVYGIVVFDIFENEKLKEDNGLEID